MMDIIAGLNPAQKEAVQTIEGPILIVAGPGSGKTRVIAHRVAYLITVCGTSPYHVLAVTFTNKAAREMKERIYHLLGRTVEGLTLGTFHATCARMLRIEAERIGIDRNFLIYDDSDQINLLKRSLEHLGLDPKQYPPRGVGAAISSAKARLLAPAEYRAVVGSYFEEITSRVYERYQELLRESNALDFDDLIMRTVHMFRNHPDILARYQSRYVHVMIDEFQDTNFAQYTLSRQLGGKYRNICVVGDPDQSIYSWRHADLRHILDFEKDFPDARVLYLEQNYRSTGVILKAADHVISVNQERKPKGLWTENKAGEALVVAEAYNEQDEAYFVVNEVEKLVRSGKWRAGDCAVMYRTNAQSRAIEEAFIRYGFPYRLVGATRFYERREVKDVLAYLRLIHNPHDGVSLSRIINVPVRGIGQRTFAEVVKYAGEKGLSLYPALKRIAAEGGADIPLGTRSKQALADFVSMVEEFASLNREADLVVLFDAILEKTGYKRFTLESVDGEERWENILELRNVADGYRDLEPGESLARFLEEVALVSDVDNLEEKADAVTLITLHQAKGLEFPVVFMVGVEEGILPHSKSITDPAQLEEERRLCYVGITRAKEKVYLVHAFRRSLMGSSALNPASRFLADIPPELIKSPSRTPAASESPVATRIPAGHEPVKEPAAAAPSLSLKAGDHVSHARFGEGVVVNCAASGGDHQVTIAFKGDAGIKRFLLSLAPLMKL
ncbi:MAG: UvrD-helicase domain-containing protein [Dehalococcoidia bacterium]|nr:UvrD-helicase domain-containing protein [Dehalococcoidia bacterium]